MRNELTLKIYRAILKPRRHMCFEQNAQYTFELYIGYMKKLSNGLAESQTVGLLLM